MVWFYIDHNIIFSTGKFDNQFDTYFKRLCRIYINAQYCRLKALYHTRNRFRLKYGNLRC